MKLKAIEVTNYRCIDDSNLFSVGDVTCLVGKNESGKTTILQALECLNPFETSRGKYNKLRDYPRRYYADYKSRHPHEEGTVLSTKWQLEQPDITALETEFGPGCVGGEELTISKRYESTGPIWNLPLDDEKIVGHLIEQYGLTSEQRETLRSFKTSEDLHAHLSAMTARTENHNALMQKIASYRKNRAQLAGIDLLFKRLPKFLYFSQYDKMSGDVSIEKLRNDMEKDVVDPGDKVFQAFLHFAGTSLEEISAATQYEDLRARVEAASIKISDQIFEYWSQNQFLSIVFEIAAGQPDDPTPFDAGTVMHARVHNELHKMTVPFSDRSAGFIWFFSFLVLFSEVKKTHGNIIILLDEPGLNLHGTAQADLLRYIKEKLQPNHQVIYTTHSPFMVPADNLACVRTVEDMLEPVGRKMRSIGTKVGEDVLSTDPDTLFPLQGALGYEITQTLFVGKNTLLVEGPSDILYLQAASAALKSQSRLGLDGRWTICPSGGLDKISAFISLFGGNRLHVAVLTDFAKGQKTKLENLRRSELLQAGHVFTVADFCNQDEADVEDLLEPELFVTIVNSAYKLPASQKLTLEKLAAANTSTPRRVLQAEAYFRTLPDSVPTFDHFTPANWLIQNPKILAEKLKPVEDTLSRFEAIFQKLNALLK